MLSAGGCGPEEEKGNSASPNRLAGCGHVDGGSAAICSAAAAAAAAHRRARSFGAGAAGAVAPCSPLRTGRGATSRTSSPLLRISSPLGPSAPSSPSLRPWTNDGGETVSVHSQKVECDGVGAEEEKGLALIPRRARRAAGDADGAASHRSSTAAVAVASTAGAGGTAAGLAISVLMRMKLPSQIIPIYLKMEESSISAQIRPD